MVEHAIKDDFSAFLDRSQLIQKGGEFKAGHQVYSPMVSECSIRVGAQRRAHQRHVSNGVLFNHHNPACDEGHAYFNRAVQRFRHFMRPNAFVQGCDNPKLFVMVSLERWEDMNHETLKTLFLTLVNVSNVTNFKLLVVTMVAPAPSGSTHGLHEQQHMRMNANHGTCTMIVYQHVCRGEIFVRNERYLTDPQDLEELDELLLSHVGAGAGRCIAQDPLRTTAKGGRPVVSGRIRRYTDTKYMRDT
jgi:hypothetical protein